MARLKAQVGRLLVGVLLVGTAVLPTSAQAQLKLLYVNGGLPEGHYGAGNLSGWTNALNTVFGAANITVTSLATDDFSSLLSFDRVVVSTANVNTTLTASQATSLQAFTATGRRGLFMGEHGAWNTWNHSLLTPLGGTETAGQGCIFNPPPWTTGYTPLIGGQLTAGITAVNPPCAGGVSGGTQVFSGAFASLFGPQSNILYYSDVNTWEDSFGVYGDNAQFAQNTATWLGTVTTPEPATWLLVAGGLLAIAARRRVRRPMPDA